MKIPNLKHSLCQGWGIFECYHFVQNGSGVLCLWRIKANLHWGVARSSRARFFVCFVASGNSALVHGFALAGQLLGALKQTKNRARILLATPQCRLALTDQMCLGKNGFSWNPWVVWKLLEARVALWAFRTCTGCKS